MKITFGRKFLGCVIATVILCGFFYIGALLNKAALSSTVMLLYGSLAVTIWFAYIGGNMWSSWIKSKYFQKDLMGK